MDRSEDFDPLARARREARRLLKDLRSKDPLRSAPAARRFVRLRSFAAPGSDAIDFVRERARLKHALAVVAEERGHDSWAALVRSASSAPPAFHAPALGGFLMRWFADHDDAVASRLALGGYVLPFGQQCFVCEAEAVRELGLDPDDEDWRAVGFDLVRPADEAAAERLFERRRAAVRAGIAVPRARRRPH